MKQKLYIVILCLFIAGKLLAYSGGAGTSGDPYQIATAADLVTLSQTSADWVSYFIQTADIDASGISGFTGIGNSSLGFTGEYNGDGHIIDGLSISAAGSTYIALFGFVNAGTVTNLGVTGANISGSSYIAVLSGKLDGGGTISSCYTSGSVSGSSQHAGGLVGQLRTGTISNCYNRAGVTGNDRVGGIAGSMEIGTISYCYSTGAISGSTNVGGISGYNWNASGTITASYWDVTTSGTGSSVGGTGLTTAQMQDQASYSGWDFNSTWSIEGSHNNAYPFLAWQTFPPATIYANSASGSDATGDGSSGNPYQSFHKAYTMATPTDTINLTGTFDWTNGSGEDGDAANTGYTINKNLTIRGQGAESTFIQAADAANTADRRIFLIGANISATFSNLCLRWGKPASGNPGGAVNTSGGSTLSMTDCIITENKADYGAIANYSSTTLTNCIISDNSTYTEPAGGMWNYEATATLTNCLFTGNSSGSTWGGGGAVFHSSTAQVTNCTFYGNSSTNGGALWLSSSTPVIKNSIFWGNSASGTGDEIYGGPAVMSYSCIAGGYTGTGNISSDPSFVDAANGDFRINGFSPCTDAGLDAANNLSTDIRGPGYGRKLLKTDYLTSGTIDMGAYEYNSNTDPAPPVTIYANSATGNDATGNGTSGNPYQSFHKAYTMAAAGDIIDLTGTFDWTNGSGEDGDAATTGYTINKNLTIRGQGAESTFIQAADAANTADRRIFYINDAALSVTIEDLTLRWGKPASGNAGGAIKIGAGTLNMNDCVVTENKGDYGGGIGNYGTAYLTNCVVSDNSTYSEAAGGMWNYEATATLTNCLFTGNSSGSTWGGGGAVFHSSTAQVTNCTFYGNSSTNGGALWLSSAYPVIQNCIFWGNSASGNGDEIDGGPAVMSYSCIAGGYSGTGIISSDPLFRDAAAGDFRITESSPCADAGDNALNSLTTDIRGEGYGRKLLKTDYLTSGTIDMGAYEYNSNTDEPPVPQTLYANSATGNDATGDGSQANPYQSFHKAYTMAIAGDTINLTGTFDWTNGTGEDGDVANTGYILAKELTIRGQGIDQTILQANSSLASADRSVFYMSMSTGTVTLEDLTIRYGDSKHPAYGGGITATYGSASDQVLVLNRVKVTECSTYDGGGIRVKYSTLQLNQSEVSNSIATFGMTGGGGISAVYSTLEVSESTISGNSAASGYGGNGGGIYAINGCNVTLTQSTVSDNSAENSGGGIHFQGNLLTITESTISGNAAAGNGGIRLTSGTFSMANSTISENTATNSIGGIGMSITTGTIVNSTIANNSGPSLPGLHYSRGDLYVRNSIIANNTDGAGSLDYSFDNSYYSPTLTDGGYNVVGVSNVAANATGGFNNTTSILYNTKYNDAGTAYTSWTQGGTVLDIQDLNLAAAVADNGGSTHTLALASGSFAAGSSSTGIPYGSEPYWNNSPDADQRGVARTVGQNTSIGAYSGNYSPTYTWTGASSTAWNTLANWDLNAVPTGTDNVVIANVTNNPAITTGTGASCNNLTVNSGASLIVNSGGSLITNGSITNNGTISMEQSISDGTWHLISVPNGNTTANTFLGDYLQYWTENGQSWTDIADPATTLTPVQGYSLWGVAKNTTYTFTGTPNTGSQSISLSYHENADPEKTADGMNLVGNPYPSSLDWNTLQVTYGTAYIWNPTASDYIENTDTDIAPMQGFFIYTTNNESSFTLQNANRSHGGTFYKNGNALNNGLILQASYGSFKDDFRLLFDGNAAEGFTLADDAWKLLSTGEGVSQLWSFSSDGKLAIDKRPFQETIQLGFANDQAGIYTIGIKEIADIPEAYLEDTKTQKVHNLMNGDYEFTWNPEMDDEMRFKLHLNLVGLEETPGSESNILIYAANGNIFIKSAENGEVRVSELTGRIVLQQQINGEDIISIPANLKTGIYLVMVQQGKEIKTEKIFIR